MCEAEEGLSGFEQNRLANASRLTSQDSLSWECPMPKVYPSGAMVTEDRHARLG